MSDKERMRAAAKRYQESAVHRSVEEQVAARERIHQKWAEERLRPLLEQAENVVDCCERLDLEKDLRSARAYAQGIDDAMFALGVEP